MGGGRGGGGCSHASLPCCRCMACGKYNQMHQAEMEPDLGTSLLFVKAKVFFSAQHGLHHSLTPMLGAPA